ncbi:hypothetical protein IFM89_010418 [Coptis chinensis]|uniref:Uncharacterized protein n=1 Tax=Coptis chinensis TaxID=261450 RepID=A0A835LLR7_9MAGN|nr:hypothetical protein IFM89_010418 [Coptis chinensis]
MGGNVRTLGSGVVTYVGGSTKLRSCRMNICFGDFKVFLEQVTKIKPLMFSYLVSGHACTIEDENDFIEMMDVHRKKSVGEDIYEPSQLHETELGEPSQLHEPYHVAETVLAEASLLPKIKYGEVGVSIIGSDWPRTQIGEASRVLDTYGVSIVGGEMLETQFLEASRVPDTYGDSIVGGETLETQFFEASRVPDTYGVSIIVGKTLQNQLVEASLVPGTCGAGVDVPSSQHVRER